MKTWWISLAISTVVCVIYCVATFRFNIPIYLNVLVGMVIYTLVFFVLDAIDL